VPLPAVLTSRLVARCSPFPELAWLDWLDWLARGRLLELARAVRADVVRLRDPLDDDFDRALALEAGFDFALVRDAGLALARDAGLGRELRAVVAFCAPPLEPLPLVCRPRVVPRPAPAPLEPFERFDDERLPDFARLDVPRSVSTDISTSLSNCIRSRLGTRERAGV
jgi:hypothetical protein